MEVSEKTFELARSVAPSSDIGAGLLEAGRHIVVLSDNLEALQKSVWALLENPACRAGCGSPSECDYCKEHSRAIAQLILELGEVV